MNKKKKLETSEKVASVILAGGEGTRLFPLTKTRCKPDVSFAGKYHLIDIPLSSSLNSRIQNVFVISQYFVSSLHKHIQSTYPVEKLGCIELLSPKTDDKKSMFLGTADAVRKNLENILKSNAEYFLILSGDQLYSMDFSDMISFAKREDADLVIAALPVEEQDAKRMGLLKIDSSSHVIDFVEKPTDPKTLNAFALSHAFFHKENLKNNRKYLGSMGIYVFKKDALISLLQEEGDDFGKHLIPKQVKKGKTSAYLYDGYWEDIGTISSYYHANLALTCPKNWMENYNHINPIYTPNHNLSIPVVKNTLIKNSLINQGAVIEAKEINHSIVGMGAWIKEGSVITDSIIMGLHQISSAEEEGAPTSITIGENCVIHKAIIDSNVFIADKVQLINRDDLTKYDGNGIYIRDGIIIVTPGTMLPTGFTL
jgi:glucose-1-phosphate adenylyltransferase